MEYKFHVLISTQRLQILFYKFNMQTHITLRIHSNMVASIVLPTHIQSQWTKLLLFCSTARITILYGNRSFAIT